MGSKPALGLDIGSSSIKLAELKEKKGEHYLKTFDISPLPPETIVDGALMNYTSLVESIRHVIRSNRVRNKEVAISVSGNAVIIKKITLPEMTPAELEESIHWEAEQYIPFDIQDVNVDAQILDPSSGSGQMDVLLVAAKKEVVSDYIAVCSEAGLRPVVIDVDTFAIQNCFECNYGFPSDETIGLIDVGASVVQINIIANGITTFTRDILMGGNMLTAEIQKQLNLSFEEAELYKTVRPEDLQDAVIAGEVTRLAEKISQTLVAEVQRSIDFFAATSMSANLSRIYISGGSVGIAPLIPTLERYLEVPVEVVNPFGRIIVDPKKFDVNLLGQVAPVAAVAIGLALRSRGDKSS